MSVAIQDLVCRAMQLTPRTTTGSGRVGRKREIWTQVVMHGVNCIARYLNLRRVNSPSLWGVLHAVALDSGCSVVDTPSLCGGVLHCIGCNNKYTVLTWIANIYNLQVPPSAGLAERHPSPIGTGPVFQPPGHRVAHFLLGNLMPEAVG